jgi:hypothetical protein
MNAYYNVVLVVFRVGAVAWLLYVLQAIFATYSTLLMLNGTAQGTMMSGLMKASPAFGFSGTMWLGLFLPIIVFFAAPLLARACIWGTQEKLDWRNELSNVQAVE